MQICRRRPAWEGLTRPREEVEHLHRKLIGVAPAVVADNLLAPVGMLAKARSREFHIVNPAVQVVRKLNLDIILVPSKV